MQIELLKFSSDFRTYLRDWEKLVLRDGVIYRKKLGREDRNMFQLVLPLHQRAEALKGLQDQAGHMGRDRTLDLVTSRFFWPGLQEEVKTYVKNCFACIKRKVNIPDRAPMVPIKSTQPMELVCIDFLKIEPSKGGIEDLLVITDHFTRFAYAIPTKNQTAKTTAKALQTFFLNYGFPQKLHSDQGRNFESAIIKELCELTGIIKTRTTPYHPSGNGQCERLNQTLLNMLGTLENHQKADWKSFIPTITHAYNATRHESTHFSPFYLMFGRHPRLPIDLVLGVESEERQTGDIHEYTRELREKLENAYRIASEGAGKSSEKQKEHYDRKVRGATVQVGDRVLVRNLSLRGKQKLANKWEDEIHLVLEQPTNGFPVFVVKREDGIGRRRTLHRNMLLPVNYLPIFAPQKEVKKQETPKSVKIDIAPKRFVEDVEAESLSSSDEDDERPRYALRSLTLNPAAEPFVPQEMEVENTEGSDVSDSGEPQEDEEVVVEEIQPVIEVVEHHENDSLADEFEAINVDVDIEDDVNELETLAEEEEVVPRRSARERRAPERFRTSEFVMGGQCHQQKLYELINFLEELVSLPLFD